MREKEKEKYKRIMRDKVTIELMIEKKERGMKEKIMRERWEKIIVEVIREKEEWEERKKNINEELEIK